MDPNVLKSQFEGKRIAILGFGKEGQSTFRYIRKMLPEQQLIICDRNAELRKSSFEGISFRHTILHLGDRYTHGIMDAELVIKSPGIPLSQIESATRNTRLTSQTELFLEVARRQVVGITGTKGKSTTASLLFDILKNAGKRVLLAGNIGIPCFDLIDQIDPETTVVFEMSSHQLEQISVSPHMAILLNIFEEHLDHYPSLDHYRLAKLNIAKWQHETDYLICNQDDDTISRLLNTIVYKGKIVSLGGRESIAGSIVREADDLVFRSPNKKICIKGVVAKRNLPGDHNLINIASASAAALLLDVDADTIEHTINAFKGLPSRLEYVGRFNKVDYYNDSIATIPEATMAALQTLPETSTLILGGKDRGIDYAPMMHYLAGSSLKTIVFTGNAGKRMLDISSVDNIPADKQYLLAKDFEEAVSLAVKHSLPGSVCLLSPAASSYDAFRNFEERGLRFKQLVSLFASDS